MDVDDNGGSGVDDGGGGGRVKERQLHSFQPYERLFACCAPVTPFN